MKIALAVAGGVALLLGGLVWWWSRDGDGGASGEASDSAGESPAPRRLRVEKVPVYRGRGADMPRLDEQDAGLEIDVTFEELERRNPTEYETGGAYTISRASKTGRVAVNLKEGWNATFPFDDGSTPAIVDPARTVRGRVVDDAGELVAGAVVLASASLWDASSSAAGIDATFTSDAGEWSLVGMPPASFLLIAMHPAGWSAPFVVPEGRVELLVDLVIQLNGALAGRITRDGRPVVGAVLAQRDGPEFSRHVDCDAAGTYRIDPLPAGTYRLTAHPLPWGSGRQSASLGATIEILPGELARMDFPFTSAVTLVVMLDPGQRTVSTVEYRLLRGDQLVGKVLFGGQDALNAYAYEDLAPGQYTACVEAPPRAEVCIPIAVTASPPRQEVTIRLP